MNWSSRRIRADPIHRGPMILRTMLILDAVSSRFERHIPGISTKVLSERLRKLTSYGLLSKHSYSELPPRTEYKLTPRGRKLARIIEQLQALDREG